MKIGNIARRAGVETSTIRYYESVGLLPEPPRTPSGYRDYDEHDIDRLIFIRSARGLGIGLEAIGDILAVRDQGRAPCDHVVDLLKDERQQIDRRIAELEATRTELDRLLGLADSLPPMDSADGGCVCHILAGS